MKRFLFILICLSLTFKNVLYAQYIPSTSNRQADYIAEKVLKSYNFGEYGDEVYYLSRFGEWIGVSNVIIYIEDNVVTMIIDKNEYKTRVLSKSEYDTFINFIKSNNIDSLPDLETGVIDGIEYTYIHFTKDEKAVIYMNSPQKAKNNIIYQSLVELFLDLDIKENFEVDYYIEEFNLQSSYMDEILKLSELYSIIQDLNNYLWQTVWNDFRKNIYFTKIE